MKQTFSFILILLVIGAIFVGFKKSYITNNKLPEKITTISEPIAVIELFTTQGCSSCPPADKLLSLTIGNKNGKNQLGYSTMLITGTGLVGQILLSVSAFLTDKTNMCKHLI